MPPTANPARSARFLPGNSRGAGLRAAGIASAVGLLIGCACNHAQMWPLVAVALPVFSAAVISSASVTTQRSAVVVTAGCGSWHLCATWWVALAVRTGSETAWLWGLIVLTTVVAVQVAWTLAVWLPLRLAVVRCVPSGPRRPFALSAAWCLSFAAADTLRQLGWCGDGYAGLAVALADAPGTASLLPLIGAQGLAFLWVGLASVAAAGALWPQIRTAAIGGATIVAGMAALATTFLGWPDRWTHARATPLQFTAIQPRLDKHTPWSGAQRDHALDLIHDALRNASPNSIVVTPETFLGESPPAEPSGRWAELLDHVEHRHAHLLVGMPHLARVGDELRLLNTVLHLAPGRQALYAKERLVPGGEYLPWPRLLGPVYRQVFSHVTQGQTPAPPELTAALFAAGTELSLSICHELSFALTMADRARHAAVLVNVSDDSWIDTDAYRAQMLAIARLRAMELGKPLLRVTHGARSVLIDPHGHVDAAAAGVGEQLLSVNVTPRDGNTPYQQSAHAIAAAPVAAWIAVLGLAFLSARRSVHSTARVNQA